MRHKSLLNANVNPQVRTSTTICGLVKDDPQARSDPPLVIIGMHRSTLNFLRRSVAKILESPLGQQTFYSSAQNTWRRAAPVFPRVGLASRSPWKASDMGGKLYVAATRECKSAVESQKQTRSGPSCATAERSGTEAWPA